MYFEELKQALYLSDEYSIESLRESYIREIQNTEFNQNLNTSSEYSLAEIINNLEEFGLCDNEIENTRNENKFSLEGFNGLPEKPVSNHLYNSEEIDKIMQQIDKKLKELDDMETEQREERVPYQHTSQSRMQKEIKSSIPIFEEMYSLAPQDSFSQAYITRYIKTFLNCFIDINSNAEVQNDYIQWIDFIDQISVIRYMSELIFLIMNIINLSEEQLNIMRNSLTNREMIIFYCKRNIKQYFAEDIIKSSFSSEYLVRWRFYGQIISFMVSIERRKEEASFTYEEEAISYIAYFLADAFMKRKQPSTIDDVLLAKKGLRITNLFDQQRIFNILGVSAIDSGQKQLAYDTFFSWLNCCPVGELRTLIPPDFFVAEDNKMWRKNAGIKAVARMKANFAYVCGIICDTYEPNSERWKDFHNIALAEISSAIELNPSDSDYHCTYGTLLTENIENREDNLLCALEQYKLYKKYNNKIADQLDSSRMCCNVLLDVLSEDLIKQDGSNFFQWANDEKIQNYFSIFNDELERYCKFPQDDATEDKELLKAQEARRNWEPYFKLQTINNKYGEVSKIQNLELLLVLIRRIAVLLQRQLKRWEYNLTDYYTRNEKNDNGITGQRNGIKPIAYYTTLDAIKFVFDDLYQEASNLAPRKAKEGEKGKNCLTVMHAKYMNDPYEGLTLIREFFKYIEKSGKENILFQDDSPESFRESIHKRCFVFLKSFTERIDNLVMWNRYASDYNIDGKNSNGCCVQLDAETFGQLVDFTNNTEASIKLENVSEDDYYLYRVVYISKDGTIKKSENPGLAPQVIRYYDTLRNLICTLNNFLSELKSLIDNNKWNELVEHVKGFLQQTFHIIIFLFKNSDYSDEVESRLILVRTPNQQEEIRLLPTSPEKLCINPFFQVYISQIMFGPNVRNQEIWTPYFQYQLNKMWRKHPFLSDKPEEPTYTHYSIENSEIHYHT